MLWKRESLDRSNVELEEALTEPTASAVRVVAPAAPVTAPKASLETPSGSLRAQGASTPMLADRGSTLGATLRFKGDLIADEDLVVQGQVEGSILHTRSLTIGAQGRVRGEIRARRVVLLGSVDGNMYALESVVLHSGATVRGDIFAPKVAIDEGARLAGRVDMDNAPTVPTINLPPIDQADPSATVMTADEVEKLLSSPVAERTTKTA
jgi:cytoskeletal protein CcmA (bactofilin family)